MGFTNVAWESRSVKQLARDLTNGPGPTSVGRAGGSWVRIADEWADISQEYDKVVEKIKGSFASQGADAVTRKLDEFGQWLQSVAVSAATNGERAEEAAVAYSVAVLAMPSVSEAIQAQTAHDVMASLAAYNGAILNGQFAEFDEAVTAQDANASAVMYQYEQACDAVAVPWQQPIPPDVANGAALKAEQDAKAAGERADNGARGGGAGAGVAPPPLAPFRADEVKSGTDSKVSRTVSTVSTSGTGGVGAGGYGPMAALARGAATTREHHSDLAVTVDGAGESDTSLSEGQGPWLPATQHRDVPFTVSEVSWDPHSSLFDELAGSDEPEPAQYADTPQPTLEQVSNRWVAPAVIGAGKGLTL